MHHLTHTAFVNACRDERGVGHHTLRAYTQDLRTFARFTRAHQLSDPLSKDDILAYHRHLRDALGAKPATIERRLVTLKSYFAWREDRNGALPSPFADVRISVSDNAIALDDVGRSLRELPNVARSLVEGSGHRVFDMFLSEPALPYVPCDDGER